MHTTHHAKCRMAKRGISQDMVEYVLTNGVPKRDKVIMGKKEALQKLESLQDEQRLLKKILDKGGVAVVADEKAIITTYNYQGQKH